MLPIWEELAVPIWEELVIPIWEDMARNIHQISETCSGEIITRNEKTTHGSLGGKRGLVMGRYWGTSWNA